MDRPIALLVMSGARERLHMAGMLASVAAVSGAPVRVFVAMNALACFRIDAPSGDAPTPEGPAGAALQHAQPPFQRFFADAAELGDAQIFPCSLAMELARVRADELPPWFGPPTGIAAFLEAAAGAQVWTF